MSKKAIILFLAEIAAVAILRLAYMVRRDKLLPRSSKVDKINRKPVYKQPPMQRPKGKNFEEQLRDVEIEGWTPQFVDGKIQNTPDSPPDA